MVKLNKIYTRTGDDGTTGLAGGARVSKADLRVEAYGTVDEANAAIGLAIVSLMQVPADHPRHAVCQVLASELSLVSHDLFDAGADLATPAEPGKRDEGQSALRITAVQVRRLESLIDRFNEGLSSLTSFVLPGGSESAARLHLARTIVRRAERRVIELAAQEDRAVNPQTIAYLNRLSDLLFVMARVANDQGKADVLWKPGKNR